MATVGEGEKGSEYWRVNRIKVCYIYMKTV